MHQRTVVVVLLQLTYLNRYYASSNAGQSYTHLANRTVSQLSVLHDLTDFRPSLLPSPNNSQAVG